MLKIDWATELYPSKEEENFGVAGDFAVVRLDELVRWLEGHKVVRSQAGPDLRGEYVNLTIEAMLAEIRALRGALRGA
jgi:hypothetical protein